MSRQPPPRGRPGARQAARRQPASAPIGVRIARRGVEPADRLGRHRWKAERSIAWLDGCRRLRVRYERSSERFWAFGLLACCRLSFNRYTDRTTARPGRPLLAW